MGTSPMKTGFHQKLAAHQADDITLLVVWGRPLERRRRKLKKGVLIVNYGVQNRAKST